MTTIAVLVKMAPDVSQLKIDKETRQPKMQGLPWKVSDFDKHAVEAAVKLKEAGQADKVVAFTYNPGSEGKNLIKEPLAMGCDEAVIVTGPPTDGIGTAKVLAKAIEAEGGADLIFAGEVSIDRVAGETGPRVAALLGIPSLYNVQEVQGFEGGTLKAVRDGDPSEVCEVPAPCVCTMNDELNHPRLPALMQILQAGKKPIKEVTVEDLGVEGLEVRMKMTANQAPKQDRKQVILEGDDAVDQLVGHLKKEGVV